MYYRVEEQIVNEAVVMECTTGGRNRSSMKLLSCCVLQTGGTDRQCSCCHAVYYRREEQTVSEVAVMLCTTGGRNRPSVKLLSCCVQEGGTDCYLNHWSCCVLQEGGTDCS